MEILTDKNPKRFVLFPIKFKDIWNMYKKSVSLFWTAEEISLIDDINDWENKLNSNGKVDINILHKIFLHFNCFALHFFYFHIFCFRLFSTIFC